MKANALLYCLNFSLSEFILPRALASVIFEIFVELNYNRNECNDQRQTIGKYSERDSSRLISHDSPRAQKLPRRGDSLPRAKLVRF